MTNVPLNRKSLFVSVVILGTAGATFTLAHQNNPKLDTGTQRNSTNIGVTPTLASPGVVENPLVNVEIDGKSVNVPEQGVTSVPTANGSATVRVDGDKTTVTREETTPQAPSSSSVNISVESSSSGNSDSRSSVRYKSSSSSSSSSNVKIEQSGDSTVRTESPSN